MQFKKGLGWKASIGPPTDMVIDENYAELGTWTNIQTSGNVMSEELTDAGGWTFAVYSHYNRGHFYNDRPKVFVTYKGGNSHKHDRFYADHHVNKPAPAVHHRSAMPLGSSKNTPTALGNKPVAHNNDNKTWRNNGHSNANVNNGRGHNAGNGNHNTPNRQIAQNTNAHHSGSGHFGGRR